jgi:RNA polymerase sigma factor (sigma-70 family)
LSVTPIEQKIIDLLQKRDQRALNLLYENYSNSLYGVILKITINEEIAEDALQETFIKVWKNSHKYDPKKAKLFTWLFRIARNTAIDKLRSLIIDSKKKSKLKLLTYISYQHQI